jgi:ribosomal protein S18 acetylase RimI-like enzyme
MSTIEPALRTDGPSILRITAEAGVFTRSEVICVKELWNEYRSRAEASGYNFVVRRTDNGSVEGYACFGPHSLTQGTYDLYWIAVDREARGQGIGRALLSYVEDEVRVQGGRLLLIETSDTPAYAAARALYESGGYHLEATIRDFYKPGDNLLIFTKTIDPQVKK